MPLHDFECSLCHAIEEDFVGHGVNSIICVRCGAEAKKVFLSAPIVAADLPGYASPVDGRWIEGKRARREDLARHNCVPYEPSMKDDQARRLKAANEAIDRKVDEHVESEIARMPARKREKLEAELRGGADTEFVRSTVEAP